MFETEDCPRLKPHFSLIAHSENIVELRSGVWNPVSVTLKDRSNQGKLLQALRRLDGQTTLKELARELDVPVQDLLQICASLDEFGALERGPTNVLDYYAALLATSLARPSTPQSALRTKQPEPILVLGHGEFAQRVLQELQASLNSPVSLIEEAELLQELSEQDLTEHEDGLASMQTAVRFTRWRDHFLVVALDVIDPILLRNLNVIATELGLRWLHSAIDGPFLLIGPTIIPQRTPCYACFESRVGLNLREHASYVAYKQALVAGKVQPGRPVLLRPLYSLAASLTALETLNNVLTGSAFTAGKVLSLYLPTMEFAFNEILRLPNCRICVPRTERYQKPLYFDTRAYMNQIQLHLEEHPHGRRQ
ncbi:TOMM precursor leader peptide-binding protein [Thermogemmatispora tikiterensis]|uniref:THIF-type NAD/FAD binding fold domain-containing protein n=1 Tax=Thermogemmatispora tikiterensis TaxID=1825093 RepID=A0A328VDT2_9CHLR|nr:TOMM precursor leader peptide-binding protein [Thermogemmatispora tikiterensis]RAQ95898.1 hypothetical protein A4R35_10155 [Thermogemmatispora tikiterensis]